MMQQGIEVRQCSEPSRNISGEHAGTVVDPSVNGHGRMACVRFGEGESQFTILIGTSELSKRDALYEGAQVKVTFTDATRIVSLEKLPDNPPAELLSRDQSAWAHVD